MASFGETLKRERELREISLRQISEATKINIRYLEALEENRFDALPGGLFNKGFIRAYATFIGVDGESMVDAYLHDLTARQQGPEAASTRAPSNLHRPAEVPQRRAARSAGAAAPERAPAPEIAFAAPPRRASENRSGSSRAEPEPAHATGASLARSVQGAVEGDEGRARHPAVTGIEVADAQAPASSRVLVWVLSLVAVTGVLFLILSLVRGTVPASRPLSDLPPAHGETAPVLPQNESGVPPAGADQAAAGGAPAVPPEVSAQSPLEMGAVAAPPAKPAPSHAPVQASAKPPVERPVATPHPTARPAVEPPVEDERATETRQERGPMKVEIEALDKTYVVLGCDGGEVLSRIMEAGETERAKCDSVIRVSAADAGAVRVSVNGLACLPLGDPGTRAFGYTIRLDDHARICPPPARGTDGRP